MIMALRIVALSICYPARTNWDLEGAIARDYAIG